MSHALNLFANNKKVAALQYDSREDRWSLNYEPQWVSSPDAYPLSPALPFVAPTAGYAPGAVKRFVENLLPEGRALDISARTFNVSKTNIFGLIHALGLETAGALRFWPADGPAPETSGAQAKREVTLDELDARLASREQVPFVIWDSKVRMSIAGYQDKLLVYVDGALDDGGRMFLVAPPLASTHILKPQPDRSDMPHLVVNEHFCMTLAKRMGLPVADVGILRTPRPAPYWSSSALTGRSSKQKKVQQYSVCM